jgi:hypothetical protein
MPLIVKVGVDHLLAAALGEGQQALDFLGRVLHVVVHGDDMGPADVMQARHDRIVLAVVSRQVDKGDRHSRAVNQGTAYFEAVVGAAVVDQYDFMPAVDRKLFEGADQFGDTACAVIDRDHDREREAGWRAFAVRLRNLSHAPPILAAGMRLEERNPRVFNPIIGFRSSKRFASATFSASRLDS